MNETTTALGASKQALNDFKDWESSVYLVDGAESIAIQTLCSDTTTGSPKYMIMGSLDGTNFGYLSDHNGDIIEVTIDEQYKLVTLKGSHVKAIKIYGSQDGTEATVTLDTIIIRWR
jgi:hypothetical protein